MRDSILQQLIRVHGRGKCHICGKPKAEGVDENSVCSYPHGMLPVKPVDEDHDDGFWEFGVPQ